MGFQRKAGLRDDASPSSQSSQTPGSPRDGRNKEITKTDSVYWNVLAIIMVGVTFLYACDRLEMKSYTDIRSKDVAFKSTETSSEPPTPPPSTSKPTAADARSVKDAEKTKGSNDNHSMSVDRRFPPFVSIMKNGDAEYFTYKPRGRPLNDQTRQELLNQWGQWKFSNQRTLLSEDFYQNYPNRDVPRHEFPPHAWQTDKAYLSGFIPEALALVERAQEAILTEYGQPSSGPWEVRARMFAIQHHPEDLEGIELTDKKGKAIVSEQGGWTTPESWNGLKRRLLHAIMTEDSFVFAMGGHSSSAGHGNHFQQSYTLQVQWILEAVFARLGVRHQARNFGNGGLGTVQHGMGSASIYGPDIDVLMWDSGMTESNVGFQDIMHRQVLLSGIKVPVLWTEAVDVAKFFHNVMGVPVGCPGSGKAGVASGQSNLTKVENEVPFAVRYMDCSSDIKAICKDHEYNARCWIDRPDFQPPKKQDDHPSGRAGWHPGNKHHQLKGRVLAFTFLQALKEVLQLWNDAKNFELSDSQWHLTKEYKIAREKIEKNVDEGPCKNAFSKHGLSDLCKLPMKARTEFTPRAYASLSSIRTLMSPEMLQEMNPSESSIYEGPDVFNPSLHPPAGAVDVLSIVEAGPAFDPILVPNYAVTYYKKPVFEKSPTVPVGKGVYLDTYAGDYYCDGTVDSWCDRGKDQSCLLKHHNDGRNGIKFDGYSGWIVINLPDVRYGIIIVKIETWHPKDYVPKTKGWVSINNEEGKDSHRRLGSWALATDSNARDLNNISFQPEKSLSVLTDRRLKRKNKPQPYCDQFLLEFAIDGTITSYNATKFDQLEKDGHIDRVVETFVMLNDRGYTGGKEKEVEAAIRISGCGREKTFNLNHVYWA